MRRGWSSAPLVRDVVRLLDRRYARRRELDTLVDRVHFLEIATSDDVKARQVADRLGDYLRPHQSGHNLRRLGSLKDGGYVLAVDLLGDEPIMSFGVGADASTDDELARLGHRVFQFDHTVSTSPSCEAGVTFFKVGISGLAAQPSTVSLAEALAMAGLNDQSEYDLLMDIEGAEWDVLLDGEEALQGCRQLSLEIHGLELLIHGKYSSTLFTALEVMTSNFIPVYVHGNNFATALNLGGRYIPSVLEVSLVRKDLFKVGQSSDKDLRTKSPNDTQWPDLEQNSIFDPMPGLTGRHAPSLRPLLSMLDEANDSE